MEQSYYRRIPRFIISMVDLTEHVYKIPYQDTSIYYIWPPYVICYHYTPSHAISRLLARQE